MKLLLDTHLLLWAAGEPGRLPPRARVLIKDPENELIFSTATVSGSGTKSLSGQQQEPGGHAAFAMHSE